MRDLGWFLLSRKKNFFNFVFFEFGVIQDKISFIQIRNNRSNFNSQYQKHQLYFLLEIKLASLVVLFLCFSCFLAATKEEWASRTIYQLLTDRFARSDGNQDDCPNLGNYCGGGYRGIINNLDYIQGMGFDAIWISPIIVNYPQGYHGYWAQNILQLNPHFGSQKDFVDFVSACHERGIWVMLDVVANHMGNANTNFSPNVPFNDSSHYHKWCIITAQDYETYNQPKIETCRMAGLADLDQENEFVRSTLLDWIMNLVKKYRIDGLRIDTVKQVPKDFWAEFAVKAGVYTVGEVFDGNIGYNAGYVEALGAVLNYPFFFQVRSAFINQQSMYTIRSYYDEWGRYTNPNNLNYFANFCDNHDKNRLLSIPGNWDDRIKQLKACNAMVLTSVGIPIVYYGTEQYFSGGEDPANRQILWRNLDTNSEMYIYLTKIISVRKSHQIWNQPQVERYADNQIYAFSRGQFFVCLTSQVWGTVQKYISQHPFSNGQVICNIFWPDSDCITVEGGFTVYLLNGEVKIYVPK